MTLTLKIQGATFSQNSNISLKCCWLSKIPAKEMEMIYLQYLIKVVVIRLLKEIVVETVLLWMLNIGPRSSEGAWIRSLKMTYWKARTLILMSFKYRGFRAHRSKRKRDAHVVVQKFRKNLYTLSYFILRSYFST